MAELVSNRPDLIDVTMPLVRLLSTGGVSWHHRSEISDAIRECTRHWQGMEGERLAIERRANGSQQQPSGGGEP